MQKQLHFNKPQLRSMIIGAPVEYLIAGRGTGKSEGVLAPKTANCFLNSMPRSAGVALGATYNQLLTRTLPALIHGWEKLGYIHGKHYIIGKKPSDTWQKRWKWKGPYRPPLDFKYFISWWNGAGCHLVSQDRAGSANGITIDWIFGDELKLINELKFKTELLPANRGLIPEFKNNPYHHGMTFTTDMPVGTAGRWILDAADKMDTEKVKEILQLKKICYDLRMLQRKSNKPIRIEIDKQLQVLEEEIADLRHNLLYFHEASTLENIHALGADYIYQQLRDSSDFHFDTQILNIRPNKMEEGFYPDFDEEKHGYFAADNNYLEKIDYDFSQVNSINCLRDSDLNRSLPLHISIDYNRRIHPLVVGQDNGKEIKIIKGLHALYPMKLSNVIDQFIEYYKPHKRKVVHYWYDHTAVGDDNETRKCDAVVAQLRKAGWVVIRMYIKQAPSHEAKYRMFGHFLQEDGYYQKVFRINRENCDKLIISICMSGAILRKDGFGKDKKSEQKENFPAEESTHYGDALDMMIYGMLECKFLTYGTEERRTGGLILRQ